MHTKQALTAALLAALIAVGAGDARAASPGTGGKLLLTGGVSQIEGPPAVA